MLLLRTLGGFQLERDDGSVIDVRGRWLAVLAIIAAGEERGASRDQLLGILWPELDQARGSHNLSQSLYSIRRTVERDVVIADTHALRIDKDEVVCDLWKFHAARSERRWTDAARWYRGDFLSGFYLEDAPEFERWSEGARGRTARDAEQALEACAEECDRRGEARATWRRLTEMDALNSRFAYQYVLALAKSGDRGGAVRHAIVHVALLRDELGSVPPTRLTELLTRLQRGGFVSSQGVEFPAPS